MARWGDVFREGAEKYWSDKVPTGFPKGSKVSATGAPPPRPPQGEKFPPNWNNLNSTERWLYTKGLPWVEEQGWLDRLENLNESWVGKALQVVDVLAEGVERSVGLIAQYKDAAEKNEVPQFIEDLGTRWQAGSMAYDVMGAPGVAVTSTGLQTYTPLEISASALNKAHQLIVDGATTEEARAALYDDMGALALRATLADAIGHIALDPLNFILPKLAPITRLHKLRANALYRSGRVGAEAVQGATIEFNKAFDALDAARKAGKPLNESGDLVAKSAAAAEGLAEAEAMAVRKLGELTFSPMQRFAIWATGGLPLSPETAAKWVASGPKGVEKFLPWNWFKLTPMSRANEVLVNVGVHGQALITQSRSVEDIVGAFNRGVMGALGDEVGHIMMTPAGRSAQGWMKYAAADINDLHAGWKATTVQRDQLHAAARLLNTNADDLLTRLVKGEAKIIGDELLKAGVADDATFAVQSLAESVADGSFTTQTLEGIGKLLTDKPFSLDTFKYTALQSVWESTSKTAVVQLGIKESGWFTRMTSSLKTIETLAFLRLNPGYAVRNFLNNEITMLARGNWGAWESSAHLMKMWDRIGVTHPRLTAGFGAAGAQTGELAAKKASTLIDEAFQAAQGILGDAAQANKNWVGKQMDNISGAKFPGDMGEYAKSAESWASIRSMSKGYTEAWSWFWKPKAPSAVDPRLGDLPDDVSKSLQNWAKGAMNEAELDAMLLSDDLNISMATVLDDAAERLGIGVEQMDDVFGFGFRESLADELLPAIKSRNSEEVETVLRAARDRHNVHMQNLLEEGWANAYKGNLELMQVDGPGGVLRSWGETNSHEFGMWEGHLKSVQEDSARIRALPLGERGPHWEVAKARWNKSWTNYYKWYSKRMKGMTDGAKKAGISIPDEVTGAVDARLAGIKKFHTKKTRLSNKFFGTDFKGDTLAKEQAWTALSDELDSMYTKLTAEQLNLSKIVDDGMAGSVSGPQADTYGAWRLKVRNARNDYMVEMREAYKVANDDSELLALGMTKQQYFDEVVGPMRASHQQVIYKLERKGRLALAGDSEATASFAETVARTAATEVVELEGRTVGVVYRGGESITFTGKGAVSDNSGTFKATLTDNGWVVSRTDEAAGFVTDGPYEKLDELLDFYVEPDEAAKALDQLPQVDVAKPSTAGAETKPFFPDANAMVKDQPELGMTINELWMRDGARIYDHIGDASRKLIDEPPMKFSSLAPETQTALRGYVDTLKGELSQARNASMYMAEFKRDAALLNYARRTNFDSFVGQMMPFAFWTTHSMYNWALWSLERPAVMATYLRLRKLFETSKGRANLPRRMEGMGFGFKVPFIGKDEEWMGPLFINPLKIGLPIDNFVYPFERMAQDREDDRARAARQLERQLEAGEITDEQYRNAVQTQSGQEWRDAMTQTANGRDNWMDFSMYLMAPHAPAIWAYNAARGRDFAPGPFLPITRTIKGITAMMGVTQAGQEGGWNIERALRIELGLPEFDAFDDYRVDRMGANMAAAGEITADENLRAIIDRDGPIFQEMQRRAGLEYGVRAAASALGIPAMAYPPGEEKSRILADQWGEAYEKWKIGGTKHLVEFYEEHPEVKGRLGLFDSPEERVTRFLVDEVNDKYYSSPSLIKSQMREALGDEFVRNFLATDTRDPMSISPEILAMWLKVIGGDPPGSLGDDALPISLAPPDVANRAQAFYDTRNTYFPNYFEEQSDYYKLDDKAQKAFLVSHPSLKQYWDWKWDWLHRNPDAAPYLTEKNLEYPSEQALREAEAGQPNFLPQEWQELLGLPAYSLTLDYIEGEDMPEVLRNRLDDVAAQMGLSGWQEVAGMMAESHGQVVQAEEPTGPVGSSVVPQVPQPSATGESSQGGDEIVDESGRRYSLGYRTGDFPTQNKFTQVIDAVAFGLKSLGQTILSFFGPTKAQEELAKHIHGEFPGYSQRVIDASKKVVEDPRALELINPGGGIAPWNLDIGPIEVVAAPLVHDIKQRYVVLHELGHKMDEAGPGKYNESGSKAFRDAVFKTLTMDVEETKNEPWATTRDSMMFFPGVLGQEKYKTGNIIGEWGSYHEMYAEVFAQAEGYLDNVPPPMRPFYRKYMSFAPDQGTLYTAPAKSLSSGLALQDYYKQQEAFERYAGQRGEARAIGFRNRADDLFGPSIVNRAFEEIGRIDEVSNQTLGMVVDAGRERGLQEDEAVAIFMYLISAGKRKHEDESLLDALEPFG